MDIVSLPPDQLIPLIDRVRKFEIDRYEVYLHSLILNVMSELGEFVPSEGGMVLIDDPLRKRDSKKENELVYAAAFGRGTEHLPGKRISASQGIVGEAYMLSKSSVRKSERGAPVIFDKQQFSRPLETLICVPLKVETAVVGVLVLYNKKDSMGFTLRDLKLIEVFAGYLSTSLQNAIDARKSKELSKLDDLTGLFNDRYFHRQLEAEVARADEKRLPLCLIFLDLDNFKSVNDRYGHLVGSQTLKEIGFIIREAVDSPEATLARYGGDEYVIVLPGVDLTRALDTADRIRMMIVGKLFMIDQGEQDGSFINFKGILACSAGVSSLRDHLPAGGTPRDRKVLLIRMADQAMYRAKELGKNTVCAAEPPKPTVR